jgi:hypothetical protein
MDSSGSGQGAEGVSLVNTVINLRVPQIIVNTLSRCVPLSFSRKTQLHRDSFTSLNTIAPRVHDHIERTWRGSTSKSGPPDLLYLPRPRNETRHFLVCCGSRSYSGYIRNESPEAYVIYNYSSVATASIVCSVCYRTWLYLIYLFYLSSGFGWRQI